MSPSPSHFSVLIFPVPSLANSRYFSLSLNTPPPLPPLTGSLAGCLAQLTADQSSVCQTGLSPGTPNGAPFSCLVGGGAGGRDGGDEEGGGSKKKDWQKGFKGGKDS